MSGNTRPAVAGELLDERITLTLDELCRACAVEADWVVALVNEGVLEPRGRRPAEWRFSGWCLRQTRVAMRLHQDLGVNLAGAALVLELLDEIDALQGRVRFLTGP